MSGEKTSNRISKLLSREIDRIEREIKRRDNPSIARERAA
jgi:hypothetical protein